MNFHFQYQSFLWFLLAIPFFILLFIWLLNWKRRTTKKIGNEGLVKQLIRNFSSSLFATKFILFLIAFAAGVLAAANLRKPGGSDSNIRKGIDVIIALDVSKSMLAVDLQPNRLERAKQMISKLIDQMPEDRVGLVLFAGRAYLQMPLTVDHGAAKMFVSSANPDAIPAQGTVISEALQTSNLAFNTKEHRFKSIILISDGEDHDDNALKTVEELSQQGVMINTVGLGSPEGAPIFDPATNSNKLDAMGNTVISRLNEDELQQIAEKTNGVYTRLESTDEAVKVLLNHMSQIERKAFGDVALMGYKTYYLWFAGPMFVLLVLEFLIPERKRKSV